MNTLMKKLCLIPFLLSLNVAQAQKIRPKPTRESIEQVVDKTPLFLRFLLRIKNTDLPFSKNLLNPANNIQNYQSQYKKALNLGIYSIDFTYVNAYEQTREALSYLNSIKELADELRIGQFFDFKTMKRLATQSDTLEALLASTDTLVKKINTFLYEEEGRPDLFILMLTGSWLESSYMAMQGFLIKTKARVFAKNDGRKLAEIPFLFRHFVAIFGFRVAFSGI